jgi:hypothetical protein
VIQKSHGGFIDTASSQLREKGQGRSTRTRTVRPGKAGPKGGSDAVATEIRFTVPAGESPARLEPSPAGRK